MVIPALNEEAGIGLVLKGLGEHGFHRVVVVDGGSSDQTRGIAERGGATVLVERQRGYGIACLRGIAELERTGAPEAVAILDADGASDPVDLSKMVGELDEGYDFVLGSRTIGEREAGSLLPQAAFGNKLSSLLIRLLTGFRYTDSGPLRVIRWNALRRLAMRDHTWGWNVEMQLKAARAGLRIAEVPMRYRVRVGGRSKISGSLVGIVRAGAKILYAIARDAMWRPRREEG